MKFWQQTVSEKKQALITPELNFRPDNNLLSDTIKTARPNEVVG